MKPFKNYIATWFYRESHEEASYYPQAGGRGDSALLHSVYMQIQVPFFTTFRHYNPEAELLFFTNLEADQLPPFLTELFQRTRTEVVTLPYRNRPPKGWYKAWMNQFYVYDIFKEMERRMQPGDTLLVCDADCLCRTPLHSLFQSIRTDGSALYDLGCPQGFSINGTTLAQMEEFYTSCYGERPSSPMAYYGGEFIGLRADAVHGVNREFPVVWQFNFNLPADTARLHEEAHIFSVLAERLHLRYATANRYVKRLWTTPIYNIMCRLAMKNCPYGTYRPRRNSDYIDYTEYSNGTKESSTNNVFGQKQEHTAVFRTSAGGKKHVISSLL